MMVLVSLRESVLHCPAEDGCGKAGTSEQCFGPISVDLSEGYL